MSKAAGAAPWERLSLAARGWGISLDRDALALVSAHLDSVRRAGARLNLTADRDLFSLALKHAADGIFAASCLKARLASPEPSLCDLGAGAGFVGVCLKIAWPSARVTLIESSEKRFRFLTAEAARLGLPGLRVVRWSADGRPAASSYAGGFDAVLARALAPLPEALRLAWPLRAPEGVFAAFQTAAPDPASAALARALAATGGRLLESVAYRRPAEEASRVLALFARSGARGPALAGE